VDVTLLDKLMNLVGELVLARNQILQFGNTKEHAGLVAPSQRLNLITTELQEGVMKTRMQPSEISGANSRARCGMWPPRAASRFAWRWKERKRNSIKPSSRRLKIRSRISCGLGGSRNRDAGSAHRRRKTRGGRLLLRAFHEGGQVNIEISDDGAGLNTEKSARRHWRRG